MSKSFYKLLVYFAIALILLSFYCALKIGLNTDEPFHHANGALRYFYMKTFGEFKDYDVMNTRFYPGLYDTLIYLILKSLHNFIDVKYTIEVRHAVNWFFSFLGIVGLFLVNKKIFNKQIAVFSCILTLLSPIFFGHMGNNPKDPIIFTSLIWSTYFFINYLENLDRSKLKYLILMSIAIGFGAGVRTTFLVLIVPLFLIWVYTIFEKKIKFSSIIFDIFIGIFIIFFLAFLTWPQIHDGKFSLILEVFERSSSWLIGIKHGIINGEFYEVQNTPRTYILKIFLYRIPLYFSLLTILTFILFFTKKSFFIEKLGFNFPKYFYLLNFILFFPITSIIITKANLYDNGRLILFTMPMFATIASISLFYIVCSFKELNLTYKSFSYFIILLLFLFFYRFLALTPYQYVYTNYLSTPKFSIGINKFEHDYVSTSYPELMRKIKNKYGEVESSKLKIRTCDNHFDAWVFYFKNILNSEQTVGERADYVILNNRNLRYRKMNCFDLYKGEDILTVKRLGLTLSAFRKIESEDSQVYMTPKWNVKSKKWYKEMQARDKLKRNKMTEITEKYGSQ